MHVSTTRRGPDDTDYPETADQPVRRGIKRGVTDAKRRRRRRNLSILVAVAVLALAGLGYGGYRFFDTCGPGFNSGVSHLDGYCIGVTDGGYVFQPSSPNTANVTFDGVEGLIRVENAKVLGNGRPVITIGLLEPITVNDNSAVDPTQMLHDLEGAYTAQIQANNTAVDGDEVPQIRLVLANEGPDENEWEPAVHELEGMTGDSPAPLVAVAGLGVSVPGTQAGAQDLSAAGIPMASGIVTADDITYQQYPGLIRVQPSDMEFAKALEKYLGRYEQPESAQMVYDQSGDLYSQSLHMALQNVIMNQLPATVTRLPSQPFTGSSLATAAQDTDLFSSIVQHICENGVGVTAAHPRLVLYAGREVDLTNFLKALEEHSCDFSLVIGTGGTDLDALNPEVVKGMSAAQLSLINSTATDATDWETDPDAAPTGFGSFRTAFDTSFHDADLSDGDAISTHDSVFAAIRAVRNAYSAKNEETDTQQLPTTAEVSEQLLGLNSSDSVPGASGTISFSSEPVAGDPQNKPLPIELIPAQPGAPGLADVYQTPGPS